MGWKIILINKYKRKHWPCKSSLLDFSRGFAFYLRFCLYLNPNCKNCKIWLLLLESSPSLIPPSIIYLHLWFWPCLCACYIYYLKRWYLKRSKRIGPIDIRMLKAELQYLATFCLITKKSSKKRQHRSHVFHVS